MKKLWFKRKLYGWGWYPSSWEGWTVTGLYVLLMLFFTFAVDESSPTNEMAFTFVLPAVLLTVAFIRLCYRTGEKPRWQWGKAKDE